MPPEAPRLSAAERAAGLVALVLGLLLWWLAPESGTDLAAQLARASFAREAPLTPVDLSWYGGVHPFGYSVLSPWLMAVLGVHLSGLLAAVVGSVLLARLLRGTRRPFAGALLGAVLVTANLASGRTTFALGLAAGLGALCLVGRRTAVALAVLTALLSPVAAAFLGLAAAVLVLHRRPGGWPLGLGVAAPVGLLALLFGDGGVQPYSSSSARSAVVCAVLLAVLSSGPVRTGALLYGGAVVAFLLHDDPFGSNVLRLGLLLAAPLLLAVGRPRVLVALACLFALSWQAGPPLGDLRAPSSPPLGPLRAQLVALGAQRVEVVAPRDHRESWYVAEEVALARGWARQQDRALNPLFYEGELTPAEYVDWLERTSVDHVAFPRTAALDFGSRREGELLRRGPVAGLTPVWSDDDWQVLSVDHRHPVAPGVVELDRTRLVLRPPLGRVGVALRWSRWLSVTGPACVERVGDRVRLQVRAEGEVVLTSSLRPRGHC